MTVAAPAWLAGTPDGIAAGLATLWGKSDAGGHPNLLLQHLLDTAAVGELLWDRFLAPAFSARLDDVTDGHGRGFFTWVCGAHDLGKATPAFQQQGGPLAARVEAAGLTFGYLGPNPSRTWRHERASARIVLDTTADAGWSRVSRDWVWPVLAGHHGLFPDAGEVRPSKPALHGIGAGWRAVQETLTNLVTSFSGHAGLAEVEPAARPPRAVQLALSGFVIMADWIASDERHFPGIDQLADVSPERARARAEAGWEALGLRPGWRLLAASPRPLEDRFSIDARPAQLTVVEVAATIPAPGLIVVEAPTGEGKTEAALAAAEVLSVRFGADGVFVGMPTQATSDPMLSRVGSWANGLRPGAQIALLHGKRLFNSQWRHLLERRRQLPVEEAEHLDEHGMIDPYRASPRPRKVDEGSPQEHESLAAVEEWLLGRKRGLLSAVAVGTVDQLLFAATRTKHVSVRFAGLAGKVVILDEVHAADVYMEQFLCEALWWLGECMVPVVLLSATLAPRQRTALLHAYIRGALRDVNLDLEEPPRSEGYPSVTAVWPQDGAAVTELRVASSWRPGRLMRVDVLDDDSPDPSESLIPCIAEAAREGGCVLVLLNTVHRAQTAYLALRDALDSEVVLVHGRLTAHDRATRTERLLDLLGPPSPDRRRPQRIVVVATQIAEQSFDVDVDLLATDLAPVDLLLQRAGRVHRHQRDPADRPPALREPRMVVTGMRRNPEGPPVITPSALTIYGEADRAGNARRTSERGTSFLAAAPLLRTAALVEEAAAGDGWCLPSDVPGLVSAAYGSDLVTPPSWREAEEREVEAFALLQSRRARRANPYRLAPVGGRTKSTLEGIHGRVSRDPADEATMRAEVRDGPVTVEVVLVEQVHGRFRTLDGHDLGVQGERIRDLDPGIALGGTVRLPPAFPKLTHAAAELDCGLPEWRDHPWTKRAHVLLLQEDRAELGGYAIRYDRELGLVVEPPSDLSRGSGTT